jgi:RNA polymerase sigma-70 factor, ECF subfamily
MGRQSSGSGEHAATPADSNDRALVDALQRGDRQAFRAAVIRFSPRMLATARAIVGPAHAEDVVQDAWLAAFRQIGSFEHRAALSTWLTRIVSNRAISHLRAHAREVTTPGHGNGEASDDWFDPSGHWSNPLQAWYAEAPEDLLSAEALQECIDAHLLRMPEAQRQVIVMRDLQSHGFEEICRELGLSAANARVLLHRARLRLAKMVNHFQETGAC